VEGNEELGKIYAEILMDDFEPYWVPSPADFIPALQQGRQFDLIVTEIEFSQGGWRDTTILEKWPVLIVTRVDDTHVIQSMLRDWAKDYLTKPINNNEFLAKCSHLASAKKIYACNALGMSISRGGLSSQELTANEFRLLSLISQSQTYSVDIALASQMIWGQNVSDQRLHTMLSRLRPKLRPLKLELEMSKTASCIWMTQVGD
jgi:DNA-binding response OmpR family regulator